MSDIRVLHRDCGGHLFDYIERPRVGDFISSDLVRFKDGSHPTPLMPIDLECPKCGKVVTSFLDFEPEEGYAS